MKTIKRIGLYCGTFDPFTIGHLDVANQAREQFDEVIIARGHNPNKPPHVNPLPEDALTKLGFKYTTYEGLLPDLIKRWERDCGNVTLVRGLRSAYDLTEEQNLLAFLRDLHPAIKVSYLMCHPKVQHISSSALKGIRQYSEEAYSNYIVK